MTLRSQLFRWAVAYSVLSMPDLVSAQEIDRSLWTTDGQVSAIQESADGKTLYVGGGFNYVGPVTGSAVPVGIQTAEPVDNFPYVNGIVWTIIDDGLGGWVLGGDFDTVGDFERQNLARIRPDGSVYADWHPEVDSTVLSMVITDGWLIIGGEFQNVDESPRAHVAALNLQTGSLLPANNWNVRANDVVRALAATESELYVGGDFTTINDNPRNRLASVSRTTGVLSTWTPDINGPVYTIHITGPRIYVGGTFVTVNGQQRQKAAAFETASRDLLAWFASVTGSAFFGSLVHTIDVSDGWVYLGGFFSTVRGQSRQNLGRVREDLSNNSVDDWAPNPNGRVHSLKVNGGTLYISGTFTRVYDQERLLLGAVGTSSNSLLPWAPKTNGPVHTMSVRLTDGTIYAGGAFTSLGGVTRHNLAALDIERGTPTLWDPAPDFQVRKLLATDSRIYAIGSFTSISGVVRHRAAALDAATGKATPFVAVPTKNGSLQGAVIYDIGLSDRGIVLAGDFSEINGQPRANLALVDPQSGEVLDWSPNPTDVVKSMVVRDSTIFIGGAFDRVGPVDRFQLAEVDLASELPTGWIPDRIDLPWPGSHVTAIAVTDSLVYAGGRFRSVNGNPRTGFAAFRRTTGTLDSLKIRFSDLSDINGIALTPSTIYLATSGFSFEDGYEGVLVGIDRRTGEVAWNSEDHGRLSSSSPSAHSILISERLNRVFVGQSGILNIYGQRAGHLVSMSNPSDAGLYPAKAPTLLAAELGGKTPPEVTLTWEAVPAADWYRVQISSNELFETRLVDTLLTESTAFQYDGIVNGLTYYWRVRKGNDVRKSDWSAVSSFTSGDVTQLEDEDLLPRIFSLSQNYPNPFNPSTRITYSIPEARPVLLRVFDMLGREVAILVDQHQPAGRHEINFDGHGLPSGLYLCRLEAGGHVAVRPMILAK